jgi:16S rRNA (adenine1518-N6/adenine1519-N6)-dimethyltransferase
MPQRRASRQLGQNFLVNRAAAGRIVQALAPRPGERVLEIGPGRGALTAALIEAAGRISAVEIDDRLCTALERRFGSECLLLYRQDILKFDLSTLGGDLVIAGNLPYSISKPIVMKLIGQRQEVGRAALMFQKEVADRLTAEVGSAAYCPLTVLTGQTYEVKKLFNLPPSSFRPQPRVTSTVTSWRPRSDMELDPALEQALRSCLTASFARRRQTLRNNLRAALGSASAADDLIGAAGLDGALRAERIAPAGFISLAKLWRTL